MDQVNDHAGRVRQVMEKVAGWLRRIPKPDVDTLAVEDPRCGAFLLLRYGWHEGKRLDNVVLAARIKGGKVWIEEDNTDLSLAEELEKAGVPKEDIVLAFHPPELRYEAGYGVREPVSPPREQPGPPSAA
jgi:hypothetical protein